MSAARDTPKRRLLRIVRELPLPPGMTGSGWPRREHEGGSGYRGRVVFHVRSFGLFYGRLDDTEQVEQSRLHLVQELGPDGWVPATPLPEPRIWKLWRRLGLMR